MDKLFGYTAEEWMFAVLDLLDGDSYFEEIRYKTGLPEERCRELEKMFTEATKDGFPKRPTKNSTNH